MPTNLRNHYQVCILSYNHPQITSRCVASVLKFVFSGNITLVHNGTEKKHVQKLMEEFPQICHLFIEENKGYSGGVNFALQSLFQSTNWVFFLTNDTELLEFKLDPINLNSGVYSPLVYFRHVGKIDFIGGVFDSSKSRLIHLKEKLEKLKPWQFRYAPGTAFLIHKDCFEKVGPFDQGLHTYWEDVDWGARAQHAGVKFLHLAEIKLLHAGGKTTRKDPYYTNYLFRRNRRRISWRHCPWYMKPYLLAHSTYRLLSK